MNKLSPITVTTLSIAAVALGCVAARGNGIMPVYYFLFAVLILMPVTLHVGSVCSRWLAAQFLVLLAGAIVSAQVAYHTSRVAPEKIFQQIFNCPIPATASKLAGRAQWYDGKIWFLAFEMSDEDFASLMSRCQLNADPVDTSNLNNPTQRYREIWQMQIGQLSNSAYSYFPEQSPVDSFVMYTRTARLSNGRTDSLTVIRDPARGRAWAINYN